MSARTMMTGNRAAAWGARLADVDYVPAFPITPQTEIIETLGRWIGERDLHARMVTLESEHSMVTAAGAAAAAGARVFTATSSQGLLYAMEMLYTVAGWRAPFVLVNVSRGLSAPITLEPDHNDVLAARDTGFLQLHASTCQEVVDLVLLAYRIGEHRRVRLPVIVNLDGFYLSFTREPVSLPERHAVEAFLPQPPAEGLGFRASRPSSQGLAVLGGGPYSYFRYEMHRSSQAALGVFDEAAADFEALTGRSYSPLETWRSEDAEVAFVMIGSFATKAKAAVDQLRDAGVRVGLVRPRIIRPWPAAALVEALRGKRGVAVIDQNLSIGSGGVLHAELVSSLFGQRDAPCVINSYVGGLGGRDLAAEEFFAIAEDTARAADRGESCPPRLLYTQDELREVRKLQAIALGEHFDAAAKAEREGAT